MRPTAIALPLGAALAAGWLLLPMARAWTPIGFTLTTDHRDFRVWNTFQDTVENDNTTEDAMFPGHTGAVLSIWKGASEWASQPHGDGTGDPTQVLGSGGANFDFAFQGEANEAGEVGDNIVSELTFCGGSLQAFTSFFIDGSGWRMYFYECWEFDDDPNTDWPDAPARADLQGIATHEFGHALGLAHSDDPTATMWATTSDGRSHRTIEPDDIQGVQSLYGIRDPFKPRIDSIFIDGEQLTIHGEHFAPTRNEVWFTRTAITSADEVQYPLARSADSPTGDRIEVTIPAEAGPGDVLVLAQRGGGDGLSNAWPLDTRLDCNVIQAGCPGAPNSAGSGAVLVITGSQKVSVGNMALNVVGCPAHQWGLFFHGASGTAPVQLGEGNLCVAGPLVRMLPIQTDSIGRATQAFEPMANGISPGDTRVFQWWYRDAAGGPAGYNLSGSLSVPFCN